MTLKAAVFATDEKLTFLDMQMYEDNILNLLGIAEDYINKNLQSSIRNAAISKTLYLNKSIEQFGSGFKRINSLCEDAGIKYSYEFADNGFTFIFYRKTKNILARKTESKTDGTVNDIESGTVNISLNKNEQAVYDLLGKNPYYTRQELADAISKSLRAIQRTLDSLRKKDLIERIGSDKSGYWKVKSQ